MDRSFVTGVNKYVSYKTVDAEIKAFLRPLNLLQSLFFFSKYSIRDNIITHKSSFSSVLCVVSIITMLSLFIIRIKIDTYHEIISYFGAIIIFDFIYCAIGFLLNFYSCIFYRIYHMNLILNIQELYKSKMLIHIQLHFCVKWNWIYVTICSTLYVFNIFFYFYLNRENILLSSIYILSLLTFDANVIYLTSIIKILQIALNQWVSDVKYYSAVKLLLPIEERSRNCLNRLTTLTYILEAYNISSRVSQFLVRTKVFISKLN